jgi:NAD-dependent DNA ligase
MSEIKEIHEYRQYTKKQEIEKAWHSLDGILKGINIDNKINKTEIVQLKQWCTDYYNFINRPPLNEVINLIFSIVEDNVITSEEYEDLIWVCHNLSTSNKYYDLITTEIQRLQGILHGIMADGIITKDELEGLQNWINDNSFMIGTYPYDKIDSLLKDILQDGVVSKKEQEILKVYFSQFVDIKNTAIDKTELDRLRKSIQIPTICTMNPKITFKDKLFCFTGISSKGTRNFIVDTITSFGSIYNNNVIKNTDYLIIGNENNPCWVFSCYGRKIEKALENRQKGLPIQIIREVDFWDNCGNKTITLN